MHLRWRANPAATPALGGGHMKAATHRDGAQSETSFHFSALPCLQLCSNQQDVKMSAHSDSTKSIFAGGCVEVASPAVTYTADTIVSEYKYETTAVTVDAATGRVIATPVTETFVFTTKREVPRVGVMIVGWGGNNGTTVTAGIMANKHGVTWHTKAGERKSDYFGSMTQCSTVRLGSAGGRDVYVPFNSMLPMAHPNDFVIGGWDISGLNLGDAMKRAEVLDYDLQVCNVARCACRSVLLY